MLRLTAAATLMLSLVCAPAFALGVEEIEFTPAQPTAVDGITLTLTGVGSCPYLDTIGFEGDLITVDLFDLCLSPPRPFTLDVTVEPLPRGLYAVQASVNGEICASRELQVLAAPVVAVPAASPLGLVLLALAIGACGLGWLGRRRLAGWSADRFVDVSPGIDSRPTLW